MKKAREKKFRVIFVLSFIFIVFYGKAYDFEDKGIAYAITSFADLECAVAAYENPYRGSIIIPSTVNYRGKELKIVAIDSKGFFENDELISITLGENILSIGDSAFEGCSSLNNIVFNNKLKSIGKYAFRGCSSLTQINLPLSIDSILEGAFYNCSNLSTINIPESLSVISSYLFYGCSRLKSISLPGISSIGMSSFENCDDLTEIMLGDSLLTIGATAFANCTAISNIEIPQNTSAIGYGAFQNCKKLSKFYIPDATKEIGSNAIRGCENLKLVSVGAGITEFSDTLLWGCNKLDTLEIRYGEKILYFDGVEYKKLEGKKSTYLGLFKNLQVKNLIIDRLLRFTNYVHTATSSYGFCGPFALNPYIETIYLGPNFKLESYSGNTNYHNEHFEGCTDLRQVKSLGLEKFDEDYFKNCNKLEHIELKNVKQLGRNMFEGCTSLKEIILPYTIERLSNSISNSSIEKLTIEAYKPPTSDGFSPEDYLNMIVYIPYGSLPSYSKSSPWNNFWNLTEMNLVPAEEIVFTESELKLFISKKFGIQAMVLPWWDIMTSWIYYDIINQDITCFSEDSNIASVSLDRTTSGIIYVEGVSIGTTTITASCGGVSSTCRVEVLPICAESISLNESEISISESDTFQLVAMITPDNTTDKTVLWESSDEKIATVSDNGLVKGISAGETEIHASCGDVSTKCSIIVFGENEVKEIFNENSQITIFSIDGLLLQQDVRGDIINNLPKGIYVIKNGNNTIKITR